MAPFSEFSSKRTHLELSGNCYKVYQDHTILEKNDLKSTGKGKFELNVNISVCFCRCLSNNDYKHHHT